MKKLIQAGLLSIAAAIPLLSHAGDTGFAYCAVINTGAAKMFYTPVFARESGNKEADAAAFIKDKSLDARGTYDPKPPELLADCFWDADRAAVEERLKRVTGGAKQKNINILGLGWAPAK